MRPVGRRGEDTKPYPVQEMKWWNRVVEVKGQVHEFTVQSGQSGNILKEWKKNPTAALPRKRRIVVSPRKVESHE